MAVTILTRMDRRFHDAAIQQWSPRCPACRWQGPWVDNRARLTTHTCPGGPDD